MLQKTQRSVKRTLILGLLACLIGFSNFAPAAFAADDDKNKELIPQVAYLPSITVYSLEAEVYPDSHILRVMGSFTNSSQIALKGYLTIYILNSSGDLLYSSELPVNNGKPFYNGELIEFDETFDISSTRDAAVVSVDFTKE